MSGQQPRFTFVSAVYNVGRYLPDFIASLEAQTHGLDDVEIVLVDDGSTDDSAQVLTDWAARRPDTVRVIRQANAGQGAARNAGILAARGEWISFPDPDDALSPDYLAVVAAFLDTHPDADLVACHRLMWDELTGVMKDGHPLRSMFRGSPYVDLTIDPERFHGQPRRASSTPRVLRARAGSTSGSGPTSRTATSTAVPAQLRAARGGLPRLGQVPLPKAGRDNLVAADLLGRNAATPPSSPTATSTSTTGRSHATARSPLGSPAA